jgi:thioredoxin reductase (NADPH)
MRNVIIIGSGPAGLTAGVYAARANLAPLLFEGSGSGGPPGGQLMLTSDVENYPGFPEGVLGPELMEHFRKQAGRFGTEFQTTDVTAVDFKQRPFRVQADGKWHEAKTVIVSTGAKARMLGLPTEQRLLGKGVSTCATCDGAFFRNKPLVVVGGGDSAAEEGNFLTRFASTLLLVHRRDSLRASKIMQDRILKNPKVTVAWNTVVEEVLGDKKVEGVRLKDVKTGKSRDVKADGMFVAIGHDPNTGMFKGQLELDENGYLITREGTTATNVPGVFAAGDCVDHRYRQAVTAAGMGCMAAIDAERWLESQHG